MEDKFDNILEKLSDPRPCLVNCKVGDEDLDGCMCDPGACVKDLMFPVDFYVVDMPLDTPGRPSHVLLGRPFLKTARFKLYAFECTFSFESNGICATFTMGDFIEEKLEEHPILWCDLNKIVVVSTLEAKPEKFIEGKALQDGVLNTTTPMSTHSKKIALVSSKGLKYVPPLLRQATKRGRYSPWMRDKKGKKDKGKLDEPGKKKSMKTNGVAENVSYMEWNHSTNLSELKGQSLKFHHDHAHNKGVYAYLVKDTSKWNTGDAIDIGVAYLIHPLFFLLCHPLPFFLPRTSPLSQASPLFLPASGTSHNPFTIVVLLFPVDGVISEATAAQYTALPHRHCQPHDRWLAKALAKASASIPIGTTARNPSQPLNDTYFDPMCWENTVN
ncbi:hypothetical protein PIB30_089636 [Stylosanthes scabra]|uniref:Uncharacterized protein n=1 Tax=Stylosanthes scabra TaxID=79078 RepID=A0ABU6TTK9_9FABA|nr:hypothetical protein [Stylosanthes scabra]